MTEWPKVATESDKTDQYAVLVPEKLTQYGEVPTGSHVTVWVTAAVPILFIQYFIN